jgi:hypothetical protein
MGNGRPGSGQWKLRVKLAVPHVHYNLHPTSPGVVVVQSRVQQAEMQSQIGLISRAQKSHQDEVGGGR